MNILLFMATSEVYVLPFFIRRKETKSFFCLFSRLREYQQDAYDTQTDADRQAHKAMPVSVALTLAGSLESVVISVNVQG